MKNYLKFITDYLPILSFLVTYKLYGIMSATFVLLVFSVIALSMNYAYYRKIPVLLIVTTTIVVVMGGLTLLSGDSKFVKMKPTIVSVFFAAVFFYASFYKKNFLKEIFHNSLQLSEEDWFKLYARMGMMFAVVALLNEIIWRNMSENFWVNFKVFGITGIMFVFLLTQIKLLSKHQ